MLVLSASTSLSFFSAQKLLGLCREHALPIVNISARFVHFVDNAESLSANEQDVLDKLLTYGPKSDGVEISGEEFIVIPRFGTITMGIQSHGYCT